MRSNSTPELIHIAPDFRLVSSAAGIKRPTTSQCRCRYGPVANVGVRETLVDGLAHRDLSLAGSEPAPASEFHLGSHLDTHVVKGIEP